MQKDQTSNFGFTLHCQYDSLAVILHSQLQNLIRKQYTNSESMNYFISSVIFEWAEQLILVLI